jgi:oligo-1,6-glucosidase
MDVISLISKRPEYADMVSPTFEDTIRQQYANGPRIHEFLRDMNEKVLSKYDIMTVGEGPGITLEHGLNYVDESRQELNMVFHFDHMFLDFGPGGKFDPQPFGLVAFKDVFSKWDAALKGRGWGSIFLGNHDFPRMVSRFGNDGAFREESAKLLATLLLSMRGTPYIYQGDEIGMTNVAFDAPADYRDIETLNYIKTLDDPSCGMPNVHTMGRDNARTPMQWSNSANGGFTGTAEGWIKSNPNFKTINVASQEGQETPSILNFYRRMVAFRKEHLVLVYGEYESVANEHPHIYAYRRWDGEDTNNKQQYFVVLNFSGGTVKFDPQVSAETFSSGHLRQLAICNYPDGVNNLEMRAWEAKVFTVTAQEDSGS